MIKQGSIMMKLGNGELIRYAHMTKMDRERIVRKVIKIGTGSNGKKCSTPNEDFSIGASMIEEVNKGNDKCSSKNALKVE